MRSWPTRAALAVHRDGRREESCSSDCAAGVLRVRRATNQGGRRGRSDSRRDQSTRDPWGADAPGARLPPVSAGIRAFAYVVPAVAAVPRTTNISRQAILKVERSAK